MIALDTAWLAAHPLPRVDGETDKNARGRVMIAGGSMQVPGALRLTGEAAFRAGAGKVQLATVEHAALRLGIAMPEAAVVGLPAGPEGELAAEAAGQLVDCLGFFDALVFGPGMGRNAAAESLLRAALTAPEHDWALVVDAAGLGVASTCVEVLRDHPRDVVLTPHPGEMAALMGCEEAEARATPAQMAIDAAERYSATVVLKGPESWIATPGEPLLRYPGRGAGTGDGRLGRCPGRHRRRTARARRARSCRDRLGGLVPWRGWSSAGRADGAARFPGA